MMGALPQSSARPFNRKLGFVYAKYFANHRHNAALPRSYFLDQLCQADRRENPKPVEGRRKPAPIIEAACWSHGRRNFFDLAKLNKAPIAIEAVRRIDELFEIERTINGKTPEQRVAVRQEQSKPLVTTLEAWLREQRAKLSSKSETAKAINYCLTRWTAFTRFLDDGRICLSNNAAERAVRGVAVGRKNWTFAGSDSGGHRAAAILTLIETCKMNDVDPQAWLTDILARLPDHPGKRINELLPWNWKLQHQPQAKAA
jgi:transposase